ncbi:MAG: LysR family transcriptional regulator [Trueperaceae bacterium]
MPLDPNLLRSFLAVAREGSVTAGARVLHRSQPAVTAQIHALEQAVGAPLFVRGPRGVRLTELGLRLRPRAEAVERVLASIDALADDDRALRDARLAIAASTTIAHYWLPQRLGAFHARWPGVRSRVRSVNTHDAVEALAGGRVDLALVEGTQESWQRLSPDVHRAVALQDDEIVAIIAPRHPLAQRKRLRGEDLHGVDLVWRERGSGTRDVVQAWLDRVGARPRVRLELDEPEALKRAVRAGIGLGFLSRSAVHDELARGELRAVPLGAGGVRRAFTLLAPGPEFASHAARAFATFLLEAERDAGSEESSDAQTPTRQADRR